MSPSLTIPNTQAMHDLGRRLGRSLPAESVILLVGELGTGKTTLVQGIGAGLGIEEPIVSPTFTLINEYTEGRVPLYHFDLYRLTPEEATALKPELYWNGVEVELGIVAIEWSDRLEDKPPNYIQLNLSHGPDGSRKIEVGDFSLFSFDWTGDS